MRRFKTKNILFEAVDPKAEEHFKSNPLPDWAENKFRMYLNRPGNVGKFGPGTKFDIEYPKPESEQPLNDYIKSAWYELSIQPDKRLYNNMLKNNFALLKPADPPAAKPTKAPAQTFTVMPARQPGPLAANTKPTEKQNGVRIIQQGEIDPVTKKQSATSYAIMGTVGEGWTNKQLGSSPGWLGSVQKTKDGQWYWQSNSALIDDRSKLVKNGGAVMGSLGFSRNVKGDDPDHQRMDQSGRHFSDPTEGGLKFYGSRDRSYAATLQKGAQGYINGISTGDEAVDGIIKKNLIALISSKKVSSVIQNTRA